MLVVTFLICKGEILGRIKVRPRIPVLQNNFGGIMSRVKFDKTFNKFRILFEDGSHGWYSKRAVEVLFPNRDWDVVIAHPNQTFYI